MTERVLDEEAWRDEAAGVVNDVKEHVGLIAVCDNLKSSDSRIYMNLTTIEGLAYCVELSNLGFRVVGNGHERNDVDSAEYFETPYSLLNKLSVAFRDSFGKALVDKLGRLEQN